MGMVIAVYFCMKTTLYKLEKLELISSAKNAVACERAATSFVLEHLFEIEKRRLHVEAGYASLHEFAVTELGYSDGAAYRRIAAMRLIAKVPEAKAAIDSGQLSLSNAALVQNVMKEARKQKKEIGVSLFELIKRVESKSARAAEQELRKIVPAFLPRRDGIKIKDSARALLTAEISVELESKLKQLRAKHAHTQGGSSLGALLEFAVDLALAVGEPKSTSTSKLTQKSIPSYTLVAPRKKFTRYISVKDKRALLRTQSHCQFVSPLTQKQCGSTFALEIDHVRPMARGGRNTADNLQRLCRAHNQWKGAGFSA